MNPPTTCAWCDFTCVDSCSSMGFNKEGCKNYNVSQQIKKVNMKPSAIEYDTPRAKLLMEVMEIVHKDRNANYGNPEDNFSQIAALWQAYYDARIKATSKSASAFKFQSMDVAVMNMLIKVARLAKNPSHHDSAVDIAGYAACAADIQEILTANQNGSASA